MDNKVFCIAGFSPALEYAKPILTCNSFRFTDLPGPEVTHLLLPIPSFNPDGQIRGGGNLSNILPLLNPETVIIGGNIGGVPGLDLLKDPFYVSQNAALTADCAVRFAASRMDIGWKGCKVLILGWGRIGKCLSKLLQATGANVTVAARKEADRALAAALGFRAVSINDTTALLPQQDIIFNTVPALILGEHQTDMCAGDCLLIELASKPGILGKHVIPALGLPGKMVPRSSGKLIAETIIRLISLKEG